MHVKSCIIHFAVACFVLTLAACGGGGGGGGTQQTGTVIGAAGGTVAGPNGAKVVIPAGALATDITINIEQTSAGSPPLPSGFSVSGQMFAFTPHGTSFAVPVTLTLPFDPASVPAGRAPALYKTNAQNQWEQVANATFNADTVIAQVSSFSFGQVVVSALQPFTPSWDWEFRVFPSVSGPSVILPGPDGSGGQVGDLLEEVILDFGPAFFDHPVRTVVRGGVQSADRFASGLIAASEDGVTFGVFTEAPLRAPNGDGRVGTSAQVIQSQSFRKHASDASLTFTVDNLAIETTDFFNRDGKQFDLPEPLRTAFTISGEVSLAVLAFKLSNDIIYDARAIAYVRGNGTIWTPEASNDYAVRNPLWSLRDFNFSTTPLALPLDGTTVCQGTGVSLQLKGPRTYTIDLSSVGLEEEFTVEVTALATALNKRGGNDGLPPTCAIASASAFLRDPQQIGGTTLTFKGLEPTNRPLPAPSVPALVPPASCTAPTADAGVLQFDAASFAIGEFAGALPTIKVSRTGGSRGAVSATFTTSDGTAIGGADYTPVNATVFFADGDSEPRIITVPTIQNQVVAPDKSVNLTLSQPGGCATLGALSTAVLTILDEAGVPQSAPGFTISGTVTGLVGTGLVLNKLGEDLPIAANGAFTFKQAQSTGFPYSVTVITQPTNPLQVCSVPNGSGPPPTANITNIAVNCVTPTANGALDPTFGDAGKVSTAFGGDETAMALQADGKIVMVGGSGSDFVLARYNANGSLDAGFGSAGTVTTDIASGLDEAHGVAIQGDGKIVVVGQAVVGRTANNQVNFDFALARYNADGSLDTSFGTGGKVTTDFNVLTDQAFAVAIQGDGKIVVVGSAGISIQTNGFTATDFGIARYNSNGTLDASFGSGGKVTTDIAGGVDLARNIVLQGNDVAILVSGSLTIGSSASLDHTGLARYDTNGVLDGSFGTGGKLTLIDKRVDEGLVLQGDGKIVLAGSVSIGIFPARSSQFALMRLTANGGPDNGFGTAGLVTTPFSTLDDFGRAVALQADGRIIVAGQSSNQSNPDFAVARYATDGTLDGSFGTGGKLTIDFFGSSDSAENVIVQPDGRIVIGGFARNGTRTGYGLARVLP